MGLVLAGALSLSAGFLMVEDASGSGSASPSPLAMSAGEGAPPQAPLDTATPTPAPTDTPAPTATPEPPTATPEPPTPVPPTAVPARAPARPTSPPPPPAPTTAPAPPAAPAVALTAMEQQMFTLHNVERANAGLGQLRLDPVLEAIARQRAQDMAAKNYFSHTSPTGETAFSIMASYGYTYSIAGENIARNNYPDDQSVQTAMTGFMNSPSHRQNILDSRFVYVGVGMAFGPDGMKYFAVVFAGK